MNGGMMSPPPKREPREPRVHDGFAIASLVLGLFPVIPVAGSVLAIVFGTISRKTAKREGRESSALAAWGIFLGIGSIVITVIVVAIVAGLFKVAPDPMQQFINCQNANIANGTYYPC